MSRRDPEKLSRREREVLDILYEAGRATVAEIMERMVDPPSNPAVRSILRGLEAKGRIRHREEGPRYVYAPAVARRRAQQSAIRHLIRTFFDGSAEQAVSSMLEMEAINLTPEEIERMSNLIEQIKREER